MNYITIKCRFLVACCRFISTIDISSGYHQIRLEINVNRYIKRCQNFPFGQDKKPKHLGNMLALTFALDYFELSHKDFGKHISKFCR